jgi:hypothetical protein
VRAAPNREMAADWRVSPWGRKNGDGGGQKRTEDRDDSVDGVDERREKQGGV